LIAYVKDTPPGFAHPIRALIAYVYLQAGKNLDPPWRPGDTSPDPRYVEAGEQAVLGVDQMIARGEIRWLPEIIAEWERNNPERTMVGGDLT
jgi:hypothetical protein